MVKRSGKPIFDDEGILQKGVVVRHLVLPTARKNSIDAIKKDRTVIIISHSISQIIDSEVVYALEKGRVEQHGHPDEVYKKGGIYKDIVDASARSLNIEKLADTLDID